MPNITIDPKASFDAGSGQRARTLTRILAEDVAAGQPCEVNALGQIRKFTVGPLAGVAVTSGFSGNAHTIYGLGIKFMPAKTLVPGNIYFAATGGNISDAAVAGQDIQGAFLALDFDVMEVIKLGKLF